ncbi:hypothetical protein K2Z84_19265 [Candidatus Binatia bacterium]|jgi:hypothetical protein|nr:hypothetical protein [Candidatus Binatia bacterium]
MSPIGRRLAPALAFFASLAIATAARAAVIEVPANGGYVSGIGYVSGWKCPPNDDVSLDVDGGATLAVPSRVSRGDTSGVCGNDGRNGFIAQINFNLFGEGFHTVVLRQNGVAFAQSTFYVATLGAEFLTGAIGTYQLEDFPAPGQNTTVEWVPAQQNFVITGSSGDGRGSEVQVRFSNEIVCNNADFVSTLSAHGFRWSALSGKVSEYQTIRNRASIGPFTENNSTVCGDLAHPITLPVQSGHAYTVAQRFLPSGPGLVLVDDGAIQTSASAEGASGAAAVAAGDAATGTGSFSAR